MVGCTEILKYVWNVRFSGQLSGCQLGARVGLGVDLILVRLQGMVGVYWLIDITLVDRVGCMLTELESLPCRVGIFACGVVVTCITKSELLGCRVGVVSVWSHLFEELDLSRLLTF